MLNTNNPADLDKLVLTVIFGISLILTFIGLFSMKEKKRGGEKR